MISDYKIWFRWEERNVDYGLNYNGIGTHWHQRGQGHKPADVMSYHFPIPHRSSHTDLTQSATQSEWLKSKCPRITHAGKDVEKGKPGNNIVGNIN